MGALLAIAELELRRMIGGRKALVVGALLAATVVLAVAVRRLAPEPPAQVGGWGLVDLSMLTFLFLQTLVILVPLLYATSLLRDEVEEGTLVYLVTRPVPRARLLLAKLAAAVAFSAGVIVLGLLAFQAGFAWGGPAGAVEVDYLGHTLRFAGAAALGAVGYASIFTLVGLISRRALIWGIAYGFLSEFVLTNIPAVVRKLTLMHYLRSVALAGVDLGDPDVNQVLGLLDLASPGAALAVVTAAAGVCVGLSLAIVSTKELRLEPED